MLQNSGKNLQNSHPILHITILLISIATGFSQTIKPDGEITFAPYTNSIFFPFFCNGKWWWWFFLSERRLFRFSLHSRKPGDDCFLLHIKKILQFSQLQDFSTIFIDWKWRWRESNPRPNSESMRFLHAYLRLGFRVGTGPKPPIQTLFRLVSQKTPDVPFTIPDIAAPPIPLSFRTRAGGDVTSLPPGKD